MKIHVCTYRSEKPHEKSVRARRKSSEIEGGEMQQRAKERNSGC
jgi:hypothetical protein